MATSSIFDKLELQNDPETMKNFEDLVNNPKYKIDFSDPKYNKPECEPENMKKAVQRLCKKLSS